MEGGGRETAPNYLLQQIRGNWGGEMRSRDRGSRRGNINQSIDQPSRTGVTSRSAQRQEGTRPTTPQINIVLPTEGTKPNERNIMQTRSSSLNLSIILSSSSKTNCAVSCIIILSFLDVIAARNSHRRSCLNCTGAFVFSVTVITSVLDLHVQQTANQFVVVYAFNRYSSKLSVK